MKKTIISAISKLTLGIALCTASIGVHAQSLNNSDEKNAQIKYLGVSDDAMVFNVAYKNPNGSKFSIVVLDQDGTPLFQEVYSDKKFDKHFKLPKTYNDKVTFVIRNFKDTDFKQSFEINTHITEDLVVTKVK
jgi:hypothetical protein